MLLTFSNISKQDLYVSLLQIRQQKQTQKSYDEIKEEEFDYLSKFKPIPELEQRNIITADAADTVQTEEEKQQLNSLASMFSKFVTDEDNPDDEEPEQPQGYEEDSDEDFSEDDSEDEDFSDDAEDFEDNSDEEEFIDDEDFSDDSEDEDFEDDDEDEEDFENDSEDEEELVDDEDEEEFETIQNNDNYTTDFSNISVTPKTEPLDTPKIDSTPVTFDNSTHAKNAETELENPLENFKLDDDIDDLLNGPKLGALSESSTSTTTNKHLIKENEDIPLIPENKSKRRLKPIERLKNDFNTNPQLVPRDPKGLVQRYRGIKFHEIADYYISKKDLTRAIDNGEIIQRNNRLW